MSHFRLHRAYFAMCLLGLFGMLVHGVSAQDLPGQSLTIVPQDASFYWASMNHSAQWNGLAKSNAYQKLLGSPVGEKMSRAYRRGRSRGFDQYGVNNPAGQFLEAYTQILDNPASKLVMPFLREIFANEVFVYGDSKVPGFLQALNRIQLEAVKLSGLDPSQGPTQLMTAVSANLKDLEFPTIVIGSALSDPSNLTDLMRLTQTGLEKAMRESPAATQELVAGYRVIEDEKKLLLTLTLDVDSIPWEDLELDEDTATMVEDLRVALQGKKLAVGVGVVNHFLIVSLGPSLDHLTEFGHGPKLLDMPRLARLKEAVSSGKSLTGAYYYSESYLNSSSNLSGIAEYLPAIAEAALKDSKDLAVKEQFLADLSRDARLLMDDMARLISPKKDMFGYSFLTEQGIEGFAFDFSEQRFADDSKPLSLLAHVGEQPALVVAERNRGNLEQFAFVQKWSRIAFDYATRFIPQFGEMSEDANLFLEQSQQLRDFADALSRTTEEKLIPAVLDGESALVIDFSERRRQWHPQQPKSSKPLPVPSLAVVMQVKDKDKLKQAAAEYFKTAEETLEWLRGLPSVEIPTEFRLLAPEVETTAGGEIFSYQLPAAAQLDESIMPHALLGNDLLVLAYFPNRSKAYASEHRTQWQVPLDSERPASAAIYFDANEFVDVANAWLRYALEIQQSDGLRFELKNEAENDLLDFEQEELIQTWDRLVDFLKCFRGISMLRYSEGDATVSHFLFRFVDVPK